MELSNSLRIYSKVSKLYFNQLIPDDIKFLLYAHHQVVMDALESYIA